MAPRSSTNLATGQHADWMRAVGERGDRRAFAALFEHFAPRVKAFLLRGGAPPWLAEEIAQETMVRVWRGARSFDPARAQLSTWIFTIARNLRIDAARRAAGAALPASDDEQIVDAASAEPGPPEQIDAAELAARLRRAMAGLPADQALILRLSYFEENPHSAIAAALSIPLGTVKSRIRLALQHLRRALGEPDE